MVSDFAPGDSRLAPHSCHLARPTTGCSVCTSPEHAQSKRRPCRLYTTSVSTQNIMPTFSSFLVASVAIVGVSGAFCQERAPDLLRDATNAIRAGDAALAERLSTEYLNRPGDSRWNAFWIRANAREMLEDYAAAVEDYSQLVELAPSEPRALLALGGAAFKDGDMESSIQAFDAAAELDERLGPQLWQRGIAHYYAGRYDDGARQFEVHRTVNPQDVENSVWHFLCVAATKGFDAARAALIPIDRDARVPMMEVFALFGGKASPEDVLAAADHSSSDGRDTLAVFYAHLYLGLYFEAKGDVALSSDHISKAVADRRTLNYMWQVARVHQELRGRTD